MISFALAQGTSTLTNLIKCEGFGQCFQELYNLGVQVAVALAFLMLIIGGVEYMLSGTVQGKLRGKKRIADAIIGLVILFLSGTVLYWINPNIFKATLTLPVVKINIQKAKEVPAPAPAPTPAPGQGGLDWKNRTLEQLIYASEELSNLTSCLDQKAKEAGISITVTAIVDLDTLKGYDCFHNWAQPPCEHRKNSCHYGGRTCRGKSYAVDLVGDINSIISLSQLCGGNPVNEGDHVHVYADDAKMKCGCS